VSAILGNIICKCGGNVPIVEGKGGTLNGRCTNPRCGAQTLVRSPAAVATWIAAFAAGAAPPAPGDKKQKPKPAPAAARPASGLVIE
jgi:hypothetical protein